MKASFYLTQLYFLDSCSSQWPRLKHDLLPWTVFLFWLNDQIFNLFLANGPHF